jgi:predicted DNA-binding transcriptional regulator AlpA
MEKGMNSLLTTREVADLLHVSQQWLELGRSKGYGPKFIRIGARRITYCAADVDAWIKDRTHISTREYREVRSHD